MTEPTAPVASTLGSNDTEQAKNCCCSCDCVEYTATFDLNGDPRPPYACLCCVPACYLRPSSFERSCGPTFYYCAGANLVRWILKKTCYRSLNPLRKTTRGTAERRAALIMLVPMTIGIELGHTVGGLVHLAGAVSAFVLSDQTRDALLSFVVQLVLIYSIHFLPARVQRLNRVGVYTCLHAEDNTEASRDSYLGMPETLEIAPETGVRRTLLVHVVVWLYVQ